MLHPTINENGSYGPFLGRDWRRLSETLVEARAQLEMAAPRRRDYASQTEYERDRDEHRRMLGALASLSDTAEATYTNIARQYGAAEVR